MRLHQSSTAAIVTATARIQNPHSLWLLIAVADVGMTIKHHVGIAFLSILNQLGDRLLDMMPVAMGEIEIHAVKPLYQNFRGLRWASITVTISRHLNQGHFRIFFRQSLPIIVVISQMDDTIRLHLLHTKPHKPQCGMGIRQNQYFHLFHAFPILRPTFYPQPGTFHPIPA